MTDVLYAARLGGLSDLYTLNTSTGAETGIGPIGYAVCALARRDDTTLFGITAKDDPTTGTTTLLVIDKATGAGTEVGPLGLTLDSSLPGIHDAELLDGVLYVTYFGTFGAGELGNDLATVDQDTGTATFVGIMVDPDDTGALCFASSGGFWHAPYPQAFGTTYHLFAVDTSAVATTEGLFSDYPTDADLFSGFHSFATVDGIQVFALVNTDLGYTDTDEGPYTCQLVSIDVTDPSTPTTTIIGPVLAGMCASTFGSAVEPTPPATLAPDPGGGVYVAFDDDTLEPDPTWTRLDDPNGYDLVQGWSTDRGRSSELDKTQTGTATIKFRDTDGILDPTNASGPFFGKLDPMRQVKIVLHDPIANADTTIFRGFASEWLYDLDLSEVVQTITLECADAFDLLAALELTPGYHGDDTLLSASDFADVWLKGDPSNVLGVPGVPHHVDDSIKDVLAFSGWPSGQEDIFSGNVQVQGSVYARRDQALQALQDRADAEFPGVANIYMSKDGVVRFRGRFARFNPTNPGYGIGSWECGDTLAVTGSTAIAPISGLSYRRSKNDLINACLALPQDVADDDVGVGFVKDDTSIATYGWRAVSFNDLLVSAGHDDAGDPTTALGETGKIATYYVDNYKDPKTRAQTISFRPRTTGTNADKLWLLMCGVEIGDLLHLTTNHPGGGGFDEDFFVEGVRYEAQQGGSVVHDVTMELDVSPRSFFTSSPFGTVDSGV